MGHLKQLRRLSLAVGVVAWRGAQETFMIAVYVYVNWLSVRGPNPIVIALIIQFHATSPRYQTPRGFLYGIYAAAELPNHKAYSISL